MKKIMCWYFINQILILIGVIIFSQMARAVQISGVLLEKGTKKPLEAVNIFILPAKIKATTDSKGHFEIDAPEGDFQWVINNTGYIRFDKPDHQMASEPSRERKFYLERTTYNGVFETTITGKADKRDDTTRTMSQSEFLTAPGSQGDPVKAVQNMPGVAHVSGFSSQVIIQGGAPQDTSYMLENHDVPMIFHFGGLTSIVTPEAIESVDYLSAGFGPEYGRVIGGLIGLHLRDPATDRTKGFVFADLEKTGGLIEGPINDHSSYMVTGRYSYLGLVLAAALKGNSNFNLTVAPSFSDLTAVYDNKISSKDEFRLVTIGSYDELSFILNQPANQDPAIRGNFDDKTLFYRVIPEWTHRYDAETTGRLSFGLGQQQVLVDVGTIYYNIYQNTFTQRAELEKKQSESWTSYYGLDGNLTATSVNINVPQVYGAGGVTNPISGAATQQITTSNVAYDAGIYWRNTLHSPGSHWTHSPSARLDYYTQTKEVLPVPRLAEKYEIDPSLFLKAATGLYYQAPQGQEIAPNIGNPGLQSERAIHATVGFDKDLRHGTDRGYQVSSDVFYKQFDRLVIQSNDPTVLYSNDGTGKAYGLEVQVKYQAKPWTASLVYTLSKSLRTEPSQGEHLFQYDQTHNINFMASVDLTENLKMSTRFRYVTGDPFTPVVGGVYDSDNDVYTPLRGPFYSSRMTPFLQADVRFDKKWVYQTWILSAYADIQNITNRQNVEAIRYSYDYSQQTTISDLPILPILGLRGDF